MADESGLLESLARAFLVTVDGRRDVVRRMLEGHARPAAPYWLQLFVATGIATLGLVLDSTAVVIGAMLVSPLMGPIVELGMGLAAGSPVLVFRAGFRACASIVAVVGGAALLTLALPFHEMTHEVAARIAPTALDLLVAIFCALAAAFTTARAASDTAAAAAGTAIAIALVPPLCVVGFGLGTGQGHVAVGAGLLFVANLSAIVLVATVVFLLLGFGRVEVVALEEEHTGTGRLLPRVARRLHDAFASRYGRVLRIAMPLALLAAVYVPLRRALEEVSWEVRARAEIARALADVAGTQAALPSTVQVERHTARVRLTLVGSESRASEMERELTASLAARIGVVPSVTVIAVPDLEALRATMPTAPSGPTGPPPPSDPRDLRRRVGAALEAAWPRDVAGDLWSWRLSVGTGDAVVLETTHAGAPLGAAGERLLAHALGGSIEGTVTVRDRAIRLGEDAVERGRGVSWFPALLRAIDAAVEVPRLHVCVMVPHAEEREAEIASLTVAARAVVARADGRARIEDGAVWSVRLQAEPCPVPDAGSGDASSDAAAGHPR